MTTALSGHTGAGHCSPKSAHYIKMDGSESVETSPGPNCPAKAHRAGLIPAGTRMDADAGRDGEAPWQQAVSSSSSSSWLADQTALLGCHQVAELRVHLPAVHHLQWKLEK